MQILKFVKIHNNVFQQAKRPRTGGLIESATKLRRFSFYLAKEVSDEESVTLFIFLMMHLIRFQFVEILTELLFLCNALDKNF